MSAGDWVLVPRQIPADACDMLAGFDADAVGDNPCIAADEMWGELLSVASRPVPLLEFTRPIFHAGRNTTVRRGLKWHGVPHARIDIGGSDLLVRLHTMSHRFYLLTDHWVRNEHDPSCRTVAGLLAEMQRVYPGFSEREEVTVVDFDLPRYDGAAP